MMDKLQTNMNAAKLLSLKFAHQDKDVVLYSNDGKALRFGNTVAFNIFTNPADCLAVVKMLSLKYDINIYSDSGTWFSNVEADKMVEFVAAAVNEVMKDE